MSTAEQTSCRSIDALLTAIDNDDRQAFEILINQLPQIDERERLIHIPLNMAATGPATNHSAIVTWALENADDITLDWSLAISEHLGLDLALLLAAWPDDSTIRETLIQRGQEALNEADPETVLAEAQQLVDFAPKQIIERLNSLLSGYPEDDRDEEFEAEIEILRGRALDDLVRRRSVVFDEVKSLGGYLTTVPASSQYDVDSVYHRRLFSTDWYRAWLEIVRDPSRYFELAAWLNGSGGDALALSCYFDPILFVDALVLTADRTSARLGPRAKRLRQLLLIENRLRPQHRRLTDFTRQMANRIRQWLDASDREALSGPSSSLSSRLPDELRALLADYEQG